MPNIETIIDALKSLDIPASNVPYAIRDDSKQDAELRAIDGDQSVKKWLLEIKNLSEEQRRKWLSRVLSGQFDPTDPEAAKLFSPTGLQN